MNQSEIEANICNRRQMRKNVCEQGIFGLVLLLIGWEGGTCFAGHLQSEVKQH